MTDPRALAGQLARDYLSQEDPTGWFEPLYAGADWQVGAIPWANQAANPHFVEWARQNSLRGAGRPALVIGCGLGDDAEALAGLGFEVTAFDISPTAVDWCRKRFPDSAVNYRVADLFDSPAAWQAGFDFILEAHTIQALPPELHAPAIEAAAQYVSPGGTLLVMCLGHDPGNSWAGPPWPLTRADLARFQQFDLKEISFDDFRDQTSSRRFRVQYRKPI